MSSQHNNHLLAHTLHVLQPDNDAAVQKVLGGSDSGGKSESKSKKDREPSADRRKKHDKEKEVCTYKTDNRII